MEEILRAANIKTAAIIDDVYDQTPRAEDIADSPGWASFLDDLGEDTETVRASFKAFDAMSAEELQHSNEFIGAVWALKGKIRQSLWDLLFEDYVSAISTDRSFLEKLEARLKAINVTPKPSGRANFKALANEDIVFIDLFLGVAQEPADVIRSVNAIKELVKDRQGSPPLIVLMSNSDVLERYKVTFRDEAGLLGAMFRVHSKRELLAPGGLERVVERLASSKEDGCRIANFIHQLSEGFQSATDRFLKVARSLDLSDYAHIQELLLSQEEQPIGSYMLDVFDRVLQYEIEGNASTIDAAQELNSIDTKRYPLTHFAGTPDTQDLVNRTIWQHPARLKVTSTVAGIPVSFGDLLVKKGLLEGAALDAESNEAMLVITPSCDLMREQGARSVLLLSGTLRNLSHKDWSYGGGKARTPILILPDGRRLWVQWELKHPQTFTMTTLTQMLDSNGGTYRIAMRFREAQALELQQQMLADLGRIGVMAKMPATFPVQVRVLYRTLDAQLTPLEVPAIEQNGAVCYSGSSYAKLVLSEEAVDQIMLAVSGIDREAVHQHSRNAVAILQGVTDLAQQLQSGLKVTEKYVSIQVTFEKNEASATQPVGYIARNATLDVPGSNAALVIQVTDVTQESRPA